VRSLGRFRCAVVAEDGALITDLSSPVAVVKDLPIDSGIKSHLVLRCGGNRRLVLSGHGLRLFGRHDGHPQQPFAEAEC